MTRTLGSMDVEALEARVVEILRQGLEVEVAADTDVIRSGVLDSLTFVDLLMRLQEVFPVHIDLEEVELDDFRTARAIARFLAPRVTAP